MPKELLLENLNQQQKESVIYIQTPLLVKAGPGSGKTRVVTHKFAYLVKKKKIPKNAILTVTFTNKAAAEMKERIAQLISEDISDTWIGTFHSQCNKILRKEIKCLGYENDFTIYDSDDQNNIVRNILKELKINEGVCKAVASKISLLKANLITPEEFIAKNDTFDFNEKLGRIYLKYQDDIKKFNALDFDDLILLTIKILEENKNLIKKYIDKFQYILVDEFQDTNKAQYKLIQLLTSYNKNITVVGDENQSIYKFRGAEVKNMEDFEHNFSDAKVMYLMQNYRSTQNILNVSNTIIGSIEEILWTKKVTGEKVCHCCLLSEEEEAKFIAQSIKDLYLKDKYEYKDLAVLYRITAQARALEDALRLEGIPYKIISGTSFYSRKEIKDIVSYIRTIINPKDNLSIKRIINIPHRGIGESTVDRISFLSKKLDISYFEAIKSLIKNNSIASNLKTKLLSFINLIDEISAKKYRHASDIIKVIIDKTEYLEEIDDNRIQNIEELIASSGDLTISDFLAKVSLFSTSDNMVENGSVSLMTIHNSKGLEFPVVFLPGLEEGILPHFKSILNNDISAIEEEKRLLYVGATRAKNLLYLTNAKFRKLYSKHQNQAISRFISNLPKESSFSIEKISPNKTSYYKEVISKQSQINNVKRMFGVGCRIKHPIWGLGVVRDSIAEQDDEKLIINFPGIGIKKIMAKVANIEKI